MYDIPFSSPVQLPLAPRFRGSGVSRSMCSCGIGIGLDRGRGIRDEAFRSPVGWYTLLDVSMWASAAISSGVRMSNSFISGSSLLSSCRIGDWTLRFFRSTAGFVSAARLGTSGISSLSSLRGLDLLADLLRWTGNPIPASCNS